MSALAERLRAPGDCRDLAVLARRHAGALLARLRSTPQRASRLLERCDAFRRPERFEALLALLACAERGRRAWERFLPPRAALRAGARRGLGRRRRGDRCARARSPDVAARVRRARVAAIEGARLVGFDAALLGRGLAQNLARGSAPRSFCACARSISASPRRSASR